MRKIAVVLCLFAIGCGPPEDRRNSFQREGVYPVEPVEGIFREPVAAVVIERNGMFDVSVATGSAFLMDKERGIFATAEHVVGLETEYKLFFCGRVYRAHRILDVGVADVGFLRIVDPFDPSAFPEPYEIGDAGMGEQVFIRGIHMHPADLQTERTIHRIVRGYYGLADTRDFVYDDLSALVIKKEVLTRNSAVQGRQSDVLGGVVLKNFAVRAIHDHVISFGGLSGGPAVNRNRQVVGINSTELGSEGEFVLERDGQLHYYPRVTLNLVPASELSRALEELR